MGVQRGAMMRRAQCFDVRLVTDKVQKFLADIVRLAPPLGEAHQEIIDYWAPEDPPGTIAYAEIGHKLVDVFDILDLETRTSILSLVEQGMQSDDELLGVAVATGLMEGIAGRASRLGTWERIREELGPHSRLHADAWGGN